MLGNDAPLVFVGFSLKCFRIERACPIQCIAQYFRLMFYIGVCTIFCQHQALPRIFFFHFLYPWLDVLYLPFVPTEVTVHALYIRILVDGVIGMTVTIYRNRVAVWILQFAEVVNGLGKCGGITMRMIHFIMDSPYIDGGMIKALTDKFAHLLVGIVPLLAADSVHEGDLCPDYQSQCVAA